MARATHPAPKGRSLNFLSIKDPHVWSFHDLGRHSDGGMTTSRQQLDRNIDKTVEVDGRRFPLYVLAEAPEKILSPEDPLDSKLSDRQSGRWYLPSADWLAAREKFIDARSSRKQRARKIAEQHAATKVVKGLAKFMAPEDTAPSAADADRRAAVDSAFAASTAAFAAAKAAGKSDDEAKDEARLAALDAMKPASASVTDADEAHKRKAGKKGGAS